MKTTNILIGLLFLLSMGVHAEGGPMNENFTTLIDLSNKAIEVGRTGDSKAFIESIKVVRRALKEQGETGTSIGLQRANARLKAAVRAVKSGDLPKGIASVEQGIAVMKVN